MVGKQEVPCADHVTRTAIHVHLRICFILLGLGPMPLLHSFTVFSFLKKLKQIVDEFDVRKPIFGAEEHVTLVGVRVPQLAHFLLDAFDEQSWDNTLELPEVAPNTVADLGTWRKLHHADLV